MARQLIAEDRYTLVLTARASSLARFEAEGIVAGEHVWLRALDILDSPQMRALARLGRAAS